MRDVDQGGALADFIKGGLGLLSKNRITYRGQFVDQIDIKGEADGEAEAQTASPSASPLMSI